MPAHMLFGLAGIGGSAPYTQKFNHGGSNWDTVDRATYTFSSTNVGALATGDKLLLGLVIDDNGANSTTSVTYGGNAMTRVVGPVAAANDYIEIWELNAATDIAAFQTIVVTLANTALGCQLHGVNLRGHLSQAVHDTATSTADPSVLTIDVPEGGAVFALTHVTGATAYGLWSAITTIAGSDNGLGSQTSDWACSAGLSAELSRAVSHDFDGGGANFKGAAVSYG